MEMPKFYQVILMINLEQIVQRSKTLRIQEKTTNERKINHFYFCRNYGNYRRTWPQNQYPLLFHFLAIFQRTQHKYEKLSYLLECDHISSMKCMDLTKDITFA